MEISDNIKEKALNSVKWVSLGVVLPKLLSPLTTIILANLLLPNDFGIVSLCVTFISFFTLIQGLGFSDFIIKEKEIREDVLYTAFWANLIISASFYIILLLTTPIFVSIYSTPGLSIFLPMLGLNLLFNSIGLVPNALLIKNLQFKNLFWIQFTPMLINLSIVVPLAYFNWGVWALIVGSILQALFVNILFLTSSRWWPKAVFIKESFLHMFKFGKFVMVEKVMEFLYANLDVLLLGYFLDLKTVGVYFLAKSWISVIFNTINGPITSIIYPSMNNFKNDFYKIGEVFKSTERRMFFLNIPIIFGVALISHSAVQLFLPQQWESAYIVLSILVIGEGLVRNLSLQRDVFKILDRPEAYPKAFSINLLFAVISFPIAAKFGLVAFCVVKVLNDFLYTYLQIRMTKKILLVSGYDFWRVSRVAIVSGIVMGGIIYIFIQLFSMEKSFLGYLYFFLLIFIGICSYLYTYWKLDKSSIVEFYGEVKVVTGLK